MGFWGCFQQFITVCPERQERLWQILADDIPEQIAGGGTAAWRDTAVVDPKGAEGAQQGMDYKQLQIRSHKASPLIRLLNVVDGCWVVGRDPCLDLARDP